MIGELPIRSIFSRTKAPKSLTINAYPGMFAEGEVIKIEQNIDKYVIKSKQMVIDAERNVTVEVTTTHEAAIVWHLGAMPDVCSIVSISRGPSRVRNGEGVRMPARRDYSRALRGAASESLPGRTPRAAGWTVAVYGDLTERRLGLEVRSRA
jgi:hypothetical protein